MNGAKKTIKIAAICLGIFIIVNIFTACFYGLSFLTDLDMDFKSEEKTKDFEEVYQNIQEIDIDAIASNITIESGNEFRVEANNVGQSFSSKVKNKTLKIEEKGNFLSKNNWKGEITITVPKGIVLEDLSIDTGAGKFKINDIQANKFDIDHGAGILEITNSKFMKADIDGGAGEINITSSILNNLDMDAGIGKIQIESSITGNSEIDCGVGEVDITLLGSKEDYTIRTEKGIGSININGESQSNQSTYGSGINHLKLEGGVGSINISFEK